ncbi:F-box protein SKIP19 [Raphanus sativus]|uniref:F-box protein SKIP19-like n=1 Tax=Raphanus sativus TaxID=3726 RepID=A0A6J0P0H4_RAPSA|nr:F-box protein SKIP19-like [Raphanus sativus]KAJ4895427.1 F-box protein SKIP19 [Raphanus sativus]
MASSSLSPSPAAMKEGEYANWAELPPELTSSILHRLGPIEIVETAQKVCRSWRRVCKDPSMWRKIVIHIEEFGDRYYEKLCRHAVGRSHGGLVEIDISHFGSDPLLRYIADKSSSHLRSLRISFCYQVTDKGFIAAIARLPLLEELEVSYCSLSEECLRVVGQSCPNLKTLKKNCVGYRRRSTRKESDDVALAIAETMLGLCHLQIFGDTLTDAGLNAILDGCPNLEHLDLRQCFNVNLVGDMEKRCLERIKVVRRPNDSVHDYPFDATVNDYPYGLSDVDVMSEDELYYDDLSDGSDNSDFDPYYY